MDRSLWKKLPQSVGVENKGIRATRNILTDLANEAYSVGVRSRILSASEVIEMLRKKQGERNDSQFATDLGISKAYLCDLYKGRRTPGKRILSKLGLVKRETQPVYEVA